MSEKLQIVCFGHDEILLATRKSVLETRFRTNVITNLGTLRELLATRGCDLVILCHALATSETQKAFEVIQTITPGTKVLALLTDDGSNLLGTRVEEFAVYNGPKALLAKVSELLGVSEERLGSGSDPESVDQ